MIFHLEGSNLGYLQKIDGRTKTKIAEEKYPLGQNAVEFGGIQTDKNPSIFL
jgi:hypothetical protein